MTHQRLPYILTVFIVIATAGWLLYVGRLPICACGTVRLWEGHIFSPENSQHLLDWYAPSHLIHGLLFFGILWVVARWLPLGWRLAIATLIESAWEIVENSDAVINKYRENGAVGYFGDAVINSVSDICMMIFGFWLARRLPIWASVALIVGFEALTIWLIRDGLALNILMLTWPLDMVRDWQDQLWSVLAAQQG